MQLTSTSQSCVSYIVSIFCGWCESFSDFPVSPRLCQISAYDAAGEGAVIQTTHTHRVPAPSVFLQKQDNDAVSTAYFDQRVPVPEDDSEVKSGVRENRGEELPLLWTLGFFLTLQNFLHTLNTYITGKEKNKKKA